MITYKIVVVLLNEMTSKISGWLSIHTQCNVLPWHTWVCVPVKGLCRVNIKGDATKTVAIHIIYNYMPKSSIIKCSSRNGHEEMVHNSFVTQNF